MEDLSIWKKRWEAIDNAIGIIEARYKQGELGSLRFSTIADLLGNLREFASRQFHFFYDGFGARKVFDLHPIPQDDATFSMPKYVIGHDIVDHVFLVTMNQIAEDIAVIQRASEQRDRSALGLTLGRSSQQDIFFALGETDRLALSVLRALRVFIPNGDTTAITYFHKSANVRVIPYMPVAMIGLPMTAVGINSRIPDEKDEEASKEEQTDSSGVIEDLLAIPHEVGHYLYWNGEIQGQKFYRLLAALLPPAEVQHWVEEIFADVVSCLVGGPAVTRSFMELLLGSIGARFTSTSDVHPTPALRPYLYFKTLRRMGRLEIADELQKVWEDNLKDRHIFPSRTHLYAAYKVVDQVLTLVKPEEIEAEWCWSDAHSYTAIYDNFADHKRRILSDIDIADLDKPPTGQPAGWQELAEDLAGNHSFPLNTEALPNNWLPIARESSTQVKSNPIGMSAELWLRIFEFNGWTTGEPHGREP